MSGYARAGSVKRLNADLTVDKATAVVELGERVTS